MTDGWGMAGWGGTLTSGGGGGGGGGGGPTVENFQPPAGTPIQRGDDLSFDVNLNGGTLGAITISVIYRETGASEVIYNREGFTRNFAPTSGFLGSERHGIPGGLSFLIRRRSGWPSSPTILVEGADTAGGEITGA